MTCTLYFFTWLIDWLIIPTKEQLKLTFFKSFQAEDRTRLRIIKSCKSDQIKPITLCSIAFHYLLALLLDGVRVFLFFTSVPGLLQLKTFPIRATKQQGVCIVWILVFRWHLTSINVNWPLFPSLCLFLLPKKQGHLGHLSQMKTKDCLTLIHQDNSLSYYLLLCIHL